MDTGWLLVGVAGLAGGLALVLVGAGIAAAPLLLPVGALLAAVAYLAWTAGSSQVVATVYEEVGDPGRTAAADGLTGRPEDRTDPDGNWRGAAADGGTAGGRASSDQRSDGGRTADATSSAGASDGIGPDGERIWDAAERDRAGGWDDWEADWEWADRHWETFERGYDDTDPNRRSAGNGTRNGAHTGRGGRRGGGSRAGARQRTRSDAGAGSGEGARRTDRESRDQRRGRERSRRRRQRRNRPDHRTQRARELLDVSADADEAALRTAYRERVKEVHPDRGGDPEAFKQVQWAYDHLTED